jgi:hypothetical protein
MRTIIRFLPLALLAAVSACTFSLRAASDVPQINTSSARLPGKVAVIVPGPTRALTETGAEPTRCWGLPKVSPQPYGQVFEDTLRGVLGQYFEGVEFIPFLPAPAGTRLVLEASLSRVGVRWGCGSSPEIYGTAAGSLRVLGPEGKERWRSFKTHHRYDTKLSVWSMKPYYTLVPGAIAGLVTAWASELSMAPFARGEGPLPEAGAYVPPPAAVPQAPEPAPVPYGAKKKMVSSAAEAAEYAPPAEAPAAAAPAPPAAPAPAPEPPKVYKPDASWDSQLVP